MRHSKSVTCRAPYLYQNNSIRSCSTENEIKRAKFSLRYDEYDYIPPCLAMETIAYQYKEGDLSNTMWEGNGNFWIGVSFRNPKLKEIVQTR